MVTKRKVSQATSRIGINVVRDIVESSNSIFQEIDSSNDIGNDAYIEFIDHESGTGCCIAAQIKCGTSFITNDGLTYKLRSDRAHYEYWTSHSLPIVGIVVEPNSKRARWINISQYLERNPRVIGDGPYITKLPPDNSFSLESFSKFKSHFLAYTKKYRSSDALSFLIERLLSSIDYEELESSIRALFAFHRNTKLCWYFLITHWSSFEDIGIQLCAIHFLSYIPSHPDLYRHDKNKIDTDICEWAIDFIKRNYGQKELLLLLSHINAENGISRGSIGQGIEAIINVFSKRDRLLGDIITNHSFEEPIRLWAVILLVYYSQFNSELEDSKCLLDQCKKYFSSTSSLSFLRQMDCNLRDGVGIHFY